MSFRWIYTGYCLLFLVVFAYFKVAPLNYAEKCKFLRFTFNNLSFSKVIRLELYTMLDDSSKVKFNVTA